MNKYDMFKMLTDGKTGYVEEFLNREETVSANAYTGLTPTIVENDEQAESYNELWQYPREDIR